MKTQLCLSGYHQYIMHCIITTSSGRSCVGHHSYTDPVCVLKTLPFQSSTLETPQLQLTDSSEKKKGKLLHRSSCSRHFGIFHLLRYLSQTDLHLLDYQCNLTCFYSCYGIRHVKCPVHWSKHSSFLLTLLFFNFSIALADF